MSEAMKQVQGFFLQLDKPTSEEIFARMDVFTMMMMQPLGERMSKEAQEHAIECKLLNKQLEAKATAKDVTTIQKNLKALEGAYKLAMN